MVESKHMVLHVNGRCGPWNARATNRIYPLVYVPHVGTEEYLQNWRACEKDYNQRYNASRIDHLVFGIRYPVWFKWTTETHLWMPLVEQHRVGSIIQTYIAMGIPANVICVILENTESWWVYCI
jgi:hypothetical protein